MQRPSREKMAKLEESGWVWSDELSTLIKDAPAGTVDNFGQDVKPYSPRFNDAAITPIESPNEPASRGQQIMGKLHKIDRGIAVREQKISQSKIDMQLMSPQEKRDYINEHGLASNLTRDEQKQLHIIKAAQLRGVEEQQALQREKARRFGDEAAMSNILRIIQNATPTEKVQLKQALEGDVTNE